MKCKLESTMFGSAAMYAVSQTMLFSQFKVIFSILSILLFLPTPISLLLKNASAREQLAKPWFVVSFASALLFTLIFNEFDEVGIEVLKLIALSIATPLLFHELGKKAFISYADGALGTTAIIVLLAYVGILPTESYTTALESWTKNNGGFINPNNGPYFLYVAAILYFFYAQNVKLLIAAAVMLAAFVIDVYSRTYLAGTIFLLLWSFFIIKAGAFRTFCTAAFVSLGTLVMILGIGFYIGVVLITDHFSQYAGSLLDIVTSWRISVALDEPVQAAQTIAGFTIKKLDSLYTEIIFYCGPLCAILFFSKIFTTRVRHIKIALNNRLIVTYTFILLMGMVETQLFNLTPIGIIIATLMYTPRSFNAITAAKQRATP